MIDLTTRYMGLPLRNPLIVGSCGLTHTVAGVRRCAEAGAGAVVLKSIFEEQLVAETDGLVREASTMAWHPEAEEYISRFGREEAIAAYLELIRAAKQAVEIPVIASVHCVSAGAWTDFASRVELAGADALELNVSVLPSDPRHDAAANDRIHFDVAREVSRKLQIPVALKVGPYFSGMTRTMIELSRTGVSALVLFNRYFPFDLDIDQLEVVPGRLYSRPEEMMLPLRWVSILAGRVACDLAASTGVHDGASVVKQVLAGAAAVQVCSALYERDVPYLATMLDEIREWMDRRGMATLDAFRGRLSQRHSENPASFERVQFMKATAGVE